MTDKSFAIALTPEESELLSGIQLDPFAIPNPEALRQNGDRVGKLLDSLKARRGIPEHRISWYTDPDYNVGGRGASKYDRFTAGHADNVPYHPNFLKVLRYFLYGPDLPEGIIAAFREEVESYGQPFTSGDITPLSKFARKLAKESRLAGPTNAEEFYKLALECGVSAMYAQLVRKNVLEVR
jgi:hypothetical protein